MISKYKFISFIKETPIEKDNERLDGESIRQFYENVISEESSKITDKLTDQSEDVSRSKDNCMKEEKKHLVKTSEEINKLKKEFLTAAQNNDLKTVKIYINKGYDINVTDSFKWSALMKAVASKNIAIVRFLLENNADLTIEDKSGNNAYKLAVRIKDEEIKDLIVTKALSADVEGEEEGNDCDSDNPEDLTLNYCEACGIEYAKKREKSHITSIVHILNENKDGNRTNLVNYTLKNTNKGYQMLVKSGWNETTGLGSSEQGRIYPVKATKKDDRYGIGLEIKNKKVSKSYNLFSKLNESKKNSKSVFKSIKDFKKSNENLKIFERQFRAYFDSSS